MRNKPKIRAQKGSLCAVSSLNDIVDTAPRAEYIYIYMAYLLQPKSPPMTKAKLFMTGGSQAVRLPAEFRFEGSEVDIRRNPVTGEVVLSKPTRTWDDYFNWVGKLDFPDDFLEKRDQPKDNLRERLLTPRRKRG